MSSNKYFIFSLISSIFYIYAAYWPNGRIIKIVALINILIVINLKSIKKLWCKYKIKRNDNFKK